MIELSAIERIKIPTFLLPPLKKGIEGDLQASNLPQPLFEKEGEVLRLLLSLRNSIHHNTLKND